MALKPRVKLLEDSSKDKWVMDGEPIDTFVRLGNDLVGIIVCCDCGLAHQLRIQLEDGQVRAWRDEEITETFRSGRLREARERGLT